MVYNWEDDPEMTGQRRDFEEKIYREVDEKEQQEADQTQASD